MNGIHLGHGGEDGSNDCVLGINTKSGKKSAWQLHRLYVWQEALTDDKFLEASNRLKRTWAHALRLCLQT